MNKGPLDVARKWRNRLAEEDCIEEFLHDEGIEGKRYDASSCPISVFIEGKIKEEIGRVCVVTVRCGEIEVNGVPIESSHKLLCFTNDFDRGFYPFLIKDPIDSEFCQEVLS